MKHFISFNKYINFHSVWKNFSDEIQNIKSNKLLTIKKKNIYIHIFYDILSYSEKNIHWKIALNKESKFAGFLKQITGRKLERFTLFWWGKSIMLWENQRKISVDHIYQKSLIFGQSYILKDRDLNFDWLSGKLSAVPWLEI